MKKTLHKMWEDHPERFIQEIGVDRYQAHLRMVIPLKYTDYNLMKEW